VIVNGFGIGGIWVGVMTVGPVELLKQSSPCPMDFTRIVNVGGRNVDMIHGEPPGGIGTGGTDVVIPAAIHPAMGHGGDGMGTGTPITLTRGLGAVALALPPCEQITTADIVSKNPGIVISLLPT